MGNNYSLQILLIKKDKCQQARPTHLIQDKVLIVKLDHLFTRIIAKIDDVAEVCDDDPSAGLHDSPVLMLYNIIVVLQHSFIVEEARHAELAEVLI